LPPAPRLVFIRHSAPAKDPTRPARTWTLSTEGQARCVVLAEQLAPYSLTHLLTSDEPKAIETGTLMAERLGCPWAIGNGLHEHRRDSIGWLSAIDFELAATRFFTHPTELVFGEETAEQVYARFSQAITSALQTYPTQTLGIVTHGTALTLFLARQAQFDPLPFWHRLGLPCAIVVAQNDFKIWAEIGMKEMGWPPRSN